MELRVSSPCWWVLQVRLQSIYLYIYMYICVYAYMFMYVCVECVCVCVWLRVCVCMYVYLHVCVYVCMNVSTCIHIFSCVGVGVGEGEGEVVRQNLWFLVISNESDVRWRPWGFNMTDNASVFDTKCKILLYIILYYSLFLFTVNVLVNKY